MVKGKGGIMRWWRDSDEDGFTMAQAIERMAGRGGGGDKGHSLKLIKQCVRGNNNDHNTNIGVWKQT